MLKTHLRCCAASARRAMISAAVAATVIAAASVPAVAHHSFVMFDKQKETTITGTVKEFENTNPHAMIVLTTQDGKDWIVQTESPLVLEKVGINDSTLSKGEKATIRVHPLKSGNRKAADRAHDRGRHDDEPRRARLWRADEGSEREGSAREKEVSGQTELD